MHIAKNVPLSSYSTMRLGGKARYLTDVISKQGLLGAIEFADKESLKTIMIGGGSNIIWSDNGFDGLVIVNKLLGFTFRELDNKTALFTVASGEDWDSVVARTVQMGYSGLEQLSLIPGTVGGTPVQNVGAYGREIKDVLTSLEAYDKSSSTFKEIANKNCDFGYRTSRFKNKDKDRFFITQVSFKLSKVKPEPPFYDSLQEYFKQHDITNFTVQKVRDAVIAVRTKKLPDPDIVANNGSFFANPVISSADFAALEIKHPSIVHWRVNESSVKISAAWLIDQAGFKNYHDKNTGMATWDKQSLVLINEHAKSTQDLLDFKTEITEAVASKFNIKLIQEPEIIGE